MEDEETCFLDPDGELSVTGLIALAHVAEQTGRHEDAVRCLHEAARKSFELNPEVEFESRDRALLVKSLKQVVNPLRNALRVLTSTAEAEGSKTGARFSDLLNKYRSSKAEQLTQTCNQVVDTVRDIFLPTASSAESRVFFNKLAGDHLRYICELPLESPSDEQLQERMELVDQTEAFYLAAFDEAQSDLSPTSPLRLSLILNLAIFYHEIKLDREKACEFGKNAYEDAAAEIGIDSLPGDSLPTPSTGMDPDGQGSSSSSTKNGQAAKRDAKPPAQALGDEASEASGTQSRETKAAQVLKALKNSLRRWTEESE